ncbi:hypothetical protein OQH61_06880 [Helicobacter sp. MIT 21-1697]|nr:hypothetical protein [Helicobacter sp. MIT 21-1697]MCX2717456.1 hypothetical protein [Helicobacter sp. MIT 21-1697]
MPSKQIIVLFELKPITHCQITLCALLRTYFHTQREEASADSNASFGNAQ